MITALFALILFALPAKAQEIAVALTSDVVEVDAGFAGARLNLFGAISGVEDPATDYDIIAVIRGPATDFTMRRLERRNLIWMPGDAHVVENAPGVYLTAATRDVDVIAPLPDQAAHHLRADLMLLAARNANEKDAEPDHDRAFTEAFVDEVTQKGLYRNAVGGVSFKKGPLFVIEADLPGITPVGDYEIFVYLYRQGVLLGQDSARLVVNKVGIERQIYDLAHQRPISYGVLCVALSLLAGWIAAFAFRK